MSDEQLSSSASYTAKPVEPCAWTPLPCGCERDAAPIDPKHYGNTVGKSIADALANEAHWPRGKAPANYCVKHRADRPCACDRPKKSSNNHVINLMMGNTKTKQATKKKGKK